MSPRGDRADRLHWPPPVGLAAAMAAAAMIAATATAAAAGAGRTNGAGAFLRDMAVREAVHEADAVRAAALFLGERDRIPDAEVCRQRLLAARVLGPDDRYVPERTLRKGFASLLFVRALGIGGGWNARLFGFGPRAAFKELEFLEMVPPIGPGDLMTGAELISLFRLAQDHARETAARKLEKQRRRARRR
jgi:hypothetical protein